MATGSEQAVGIWGVADVHGDTVEVNVEPTPAAKWRDENDQDVTEPVVYVTGDVYLTPVQALDMAIALQEASARVIALRQEQTP